MSLPPEKPVRVQSTIRRRPEITIVSARPMSEVGFRDKQVKLGGDADNALPGGKLNFDASDSPSDGMTSKMVSSSRPTSMRRPPPIPSRVPSSSSQINSTSSTKLDPPSREHLSLTPSQPDGGHKKPPATGPPPPVPRRTAVSMGGEANNLSVSGSVSPATVPVESSSHEVQSTILASLQSTASDKPRPPTIIRPGRPPVTGVGESKYDSKLVLAPKVSPRPSRFEIAVPTSTESQTTHSCQQDSGASNDSRLPGDLLKSKVTLTPQLQDEDNQIPSLTGMLHGDQCSPTQTAKPKPALPPKPTVARLGADHTESPLRPVSQCPETKTALDQESVGSAVETGSLNRSGFKRPTIIRPVKPRKPDSNENCSSKHETIQSDEKTDSDLELKSKGAEPPGPAKSPVLFMEAHHIVKDEHRQSVSKSFPDDVSLQRRPKPSPRTSSNIMRPVSVDVSSLPSDTTTSLSEQPKRPLPPSRQSYLKSVTSESSVLEVSEKVSFGPKRPISGSDNALLLQTSQQTEGSKGASDNSSTSARTVKRPPPPRRLGNQSPEDVKEKEKSTNLPFKPNRASNNSNSSDDDFHSLSKKEQRPGRLSSEGPSARPVVEKQTEKNRETEEDHKPVLRRPPPPTKRPTSVANTSVKEVDRRPLRPTAPPTQSPKSQEPQELGVPELPPRPGPGHSLYSYMLDRPFGIALFDYAASQSDELSFKEGDVVSLVREVDDQWLMGQVTNQEGIFPRSFIDIRVPLKDKPHIQEDDESSNSETEFFDATSQQLDYLGHGPRCRARFDFDGDNSEDLTFEDGDVIRLLERVGPEWFRGECRGRKGLFPLSFVEIIEDLPQDENCETSDNMVQAVFDFDGDDDELTFQAGELIKVIYRVNEKWLYGEMGHSSAGTFPVEFVDHVPADLPTRATSQSLNSAFRDPPGDSQSQHFDPVRVSGLAQSGMKSESGMVSTYCVALFDFEGQEDGDLGFKRGDTIEVLERIGSDWIRGKLGDKTGIFPVTFVQDGDNSHSRDEAGSSIGSQLHDQHAEYGVAVHEFDGEQDKELSFKVGDRLCLLEKVEGAEEWQWGRLGHKKGIFPATFVKPERH